MQIVSRSRWYETAPLGRGMRPNYVNGAIEVNTGLPPQSLLKLLKKLEKIAGRRESGHWNDRPLDLDIVDYKGVILNWDIRCRRVLQAPRGDLILPHARLHQRLFVLIPIKEIMQGWRHPVLRLSLDELLKRTKRRSEGRIIRTLPPGTCGGQ